MENSQLGSASYNNSAVAEMSKEERTELFDYAAEVSATLPLVEQSEVSWTYVADTVMSGFPTECEMYSCRKTKFLDALSFSALYADQIVLFDPFDPILKGCDRDNISDFFAEELKFASELVSLSLPLIEAGIARFAEFSPANLCHDCFDKAFAEFKLTDSAESPLIAIHKLLVDNSKVTVVDENASDLQVAIESDLIHSDHGTITVWGSKSLFTKSVPKVGEVLRKSTVKDIELFNHQAWFMSADILSKNRVASEINSSGIFGNDVEMIAMKHAFGKAFSGTQTHGNLPFLRALDIDRLLQIRQKEERHLVRYRSMFTDTVLSTEETGVDPDKFYRTKIEPELLDLEQRLELARTNARSDLIDNSGVSLLSIATSVATLDSSALIAGAAAVVGSGHFAKSMVPAIRKLVSEPHDLKKSRAYYSWKVTKRL